MDLEDILASDSEEGSVSGGGLGADVDAILAQADDGRVAGVEHDGGEISSDDEMLEAILQENSMPQALVAPVLQASNVSSHNVAVQSRPYGQSVAQHQPVASAALPRTTGSSAPHLSSSTMAALPAPVKVAAVPAPVAAAAPPAKQPSPLNHKHHTDEDILNALLASDSEDEDDGGLSAQIANAMSRVAPTMATTNSASRSQPASVMTPAARNAAVIAAEMRDRRDTRASSVTSASSGESGPSDGGGGSRRASFAAQAPAGALAQRHREETVEDILAAADAVAVQYLSPDKASQLLASGSAGGSSSAGLHINATSGRRAHHQQSVAGGGAGDDADSMLADIEAEVIVNRAARGHGANNAVFQSPEVALPSPMGINDDVDGIVRRAASAVRAARGAGVSVPLPRGLLSADDIINSADGAGDDEDDEGVGTSSSPAAHPRRNGAIQGDGSSGEGGGDLDLESIIQQYAASTTASASANSKGGSNNDGSNQHRDGKAAAGRRGSLEGLLADGDTSFDSSSNQQLQRPGTRTEGRMQSGADAEADAGLAQVHHSVNALKRAAARQTKLLKSGNSKVVSPLAARRRFKPGLRSPQQALRAARSRVANRAAASGLTMHLPGVGTGMMGPSRRGSMESATASMISAALDDDGTGLSVSASALGPQHQQDANGGSGIAGQELALTGILRNGRSLISPYRSSATALLPPSLVEGADGEIDTSAILNATNQTVGRSIMGLLRVQPLQGLSDAIKRNMKNLATSPGLPTCITVHPKFTAIGTSRSLVMLFDNTQALRCILSRQPAGGADNSKTAGGGDGAVTSMDSLNGLDFLLIGYASGRVTLVDTSNLAKSTVLKVAEVHKSSITAVRFTSFGAPNAVSVDAAGVVNFLSFSKVLGLRWSVESKCVLDGTRTGPIVSVAVLLPPLHAGTDGASDGKGGSGNILTSAFSTGATSSGTGTAGGASAGGGAGASGAGAAGPLYGTLIALATRDYTYMLATNPEISVVHKWARPDGVHPAVVPSMAWARARVHGSAALDAAEERRSSAMIMSALQPGQQHAHANSSLSLASVVDKAAAALGSDTQHQRQGGPPSRRSSFSDQSSLARGGPGVAGDSDSTHGSGSATGASNAGADTPASAAATAINMHRAAVAARYRHGSTLPYHGVMTAMPAPVLARAWGSHLQLLQVQPPGGYPMEQTNLAAPIEQFDGQHHMMVPHGPGAAGMPRQSGPPGRAPGQASSGAGVGDAVFGSLTQALMSGGGLDNVGPASGAPGRHGQPGGAASATAAAAAAAASGRLMEFVLADDLDSQDPITSITWLGPSSLAYLTATDRLCLIDTSALEESDAVEMGSIKLVYASSSGASEGADAAGAGAATAGGAGKTSQQPPQTARSAASQPSVAAAASGSSAPSAQLASGAAIPIEPLDRYPPSVRGKLTSSLQNAMAVGQFEGSGLLHMLGLEQVFGARMQRWNERVSGLVAEGEWMSALALALDTYDTVTATHFTAIATAEKQARWNAMRAAALARIAVQSGAAVSVAGGAAGGPAAGAAAGAGGAAKPGAAGGAGSASPSVVSGASAADAAATAAANAQYDPVKFDRLRNGPGPAAKGTPIGDELDRLLKQYVSEMMANPPVDNEGGKQALLPPKRQHAHHHRHTHSRAVGRSLAETHWVILSSVVIDYCVTIKRPDLLFGEIFDRFHAADKHAFLLEQLEPYILSDRLTVLPPLVLKSFVDHFRNIGALPSVERCLLHLDLASLDLDGSTRICLRHRLYSALVYVANAGLMDYSLPIDLMMAALMDDGNGLSSSSSQPGSKRNSFASAGRRGSDGSDVLDDTPNRGRSNTAASTDLVPMTSHDRTHLGYALMLYLAYCLTGRVFPSGKRADRHSTASSARGQQQHLDALFSAALLPILPQELLTPVAAVLFGQGRLPFIGAQGQRGGALIAGGAAGRQMMLGPGGARGPRAPGAGAGGAAGGAGGQYRQLSTWELLFTPVDKLRPALVTAGAPGADARGGGKGAIAPSGPAAAVSVAGPMQGVRSPAMARYGAAAAAGAAEGAGRPVVPALPAGRGMLLAGAAASGHQGPGDISGVVSPRTRAGGHTERRGHLPPGMTTQSLRSDTLAFLLTHKPDRFPAVGASVLSAGGLLAGAQACDHLPGPYPRLQVLLKFDAVAWYQLLGRLFTDAADSVLHTILLMEGLPGLRIRRRCLQGEQPPLVDVSGGRSAAAPATARAPAAQTEASSGQRRQQGGTGSQTNTPREGVGAATATGPSLQMILSATLDAAMSLVAATGGATTLSSSRLQQGGAASRLASSQSGSQQQPLDNRVALALAFTVHQATRTGPGVPSLVTIPSSPPQLLTDVLLWLADVGSSKPSAAARPSRNSLNGGHSLADSDAAVSDEVLNALLTAWDVRNDEDLYGSTTSSSTSGNAAGSSPTAMMMGAGAGSLKRAGSDLNSSTISGGGGLDASYSSDVGALYGGASARDQVGKVQSRSRSSSLVDAAHSLISPESAIGAAGGGATSMPDPRSQVLSRYTRQVLLVRMLRTVEVPADVRKLLLDVVRANDLHHAATILHALAGDAPAVVDAFIRAGTTGHDTVFASRVFNFVRGYVMMLDSAGGLGIINHASAGGSNNGAVSTAAGAGAPDDVPVDAGLIAATAPPQMTGAAARLGLAGLLPAGVEASEVGLAAALLSPDVSLDPEHERSLALMVKAELLSRPSIQQALRSAQSELARGAPGGAAAASSAATRYGQQFPAGLADGDASSMSSTPRFEGSASAVASSPLPKEVAGLELRTLRMHLMRSLPKLVAINEQAVAELIVDLFPDKSNEVITALDAFPQLQYAYLTHFLRKAGVLGAAAGSSDDAADADASLQQQQGIGGGQPTQQQSAVNVSPDIHLRYISLLCKFNPSGVVSYLSTASNYPLDATLQLVRDTHQHAEATAFLLERTGDPRSALDLLLTALENRLDILYSALKTAAASGSGDISSKQQPQQQQSGKKQQQPAKPTSGPPQQHHPHYILPHMTHGYATRLHECCPKEVDAYQQSLNAAISLCTRAVSRYADEDLVEGLWFAALDTLVLRQRDVKNEAARTATALSSSSAANNASATATAAQAGHAAMLMTLGDGVKSILESMKTSVPLNRVLNKVLSDHSKAEFGEFRETIVSMMGTYSYEARILHTANHLMSTDIYRQVQRLHGGYAAAVAPSRSRGSCSACGTHLVAVGSGGKLVATAPGATTRAGRNRAETDGDDDEDGAKQQSSSGMLMVFGCGHCYHERCLEVAATTCPQCAQKENGGGDGDNNDADIRSRQSWRVSATGRGGNGNNREHANSKIAHGVILGRAGVFGSTTGGGNRNRDNSIEDDTVTGNNKDATMKSLSATAKANSDNLDSDDVYRERLARTREKQRRGRPLMQLYSELTTAPGTMQVRTVELNTAPPRKLGATDGFKVVRRRAQQRDPAAAVANCTHASMDLPPFDE